MVHITSAPPARLRHSFRTRDGLWHADMVDIVRDIRQDIAAMVSTPSPDERIPLLFSRLARELEDEGEAITLLVQNILARPVLVSIFPEWSPSANGEKLDELTGILLPHLHHRLKPLERFYGKVGAKCGTLDNSDKRLDYLTTVFDEFFRLAYPLLSQQHGIVHTPVQIVDFMIHSIEHLLNEHGGRSLVDPDLKICDPFMGTGIFPVRLIDILKDFGTSASLGDRLQGREIVRLSGRLAELQVTQALQAATGQGEVWKNCRIGDTFENGRQRGLLDGLLAEPPLEDPDVIIGNPPWSLAQRHEDDGHRKTSYPGLDARIMATYDPGIKGTNKVPLLDSYVRALRWSSDRLTPGGILGFVINSAFLRGKSVPGLRRSLVQEFSHIYIVDLRGDIRNNIHTEWQSGEGENIFGGRIMTGCALLFLVRKNTGCRSGGRVFYHRMADNLTTTDKRDQLARWGHLAGLAWQELTPDSNHDWFQRRDATFREFMAVAPSRATGGEATWFRESREPIKPTSEAWCINACQKAARSNMQDFAKVYNGVATGKGKPATAIKWTRKLEQLARTGQRVDPAKGKVRTVMLRPFVKRYLCHHPDLPLGRGFMQDIDGSNGKNASGPGDDTGNRLIVPFNGGPVLGFSALMVDVPTVMAAGSANYCLPKYALPPPPSGNSFVTATGERPERGFRAGQGTFGVPTS